MPTPTKVAQIVYTIKYQCRDEGVLSSLLPRLSQVLHCNHLSLDRISPVTRSALTFRRGAKRLFQLRLIRKSGRYLVELSGIDATQVMAGIHVCRDHFDRWFGITGRDITIYEQFCTDRVPN